jgi:hypothetical protein
MTGIGRSSWMKFFPTTKLLAGGNPPALDTDFDSETRRKEDALWLKN